MQKSGLISGHTFVSWDFFYFTVICVNLLSLNGFYMNNITYPFLLKLDLKINIQNAYMHCSTRTEPIYWAD